MKFTLFIAFIIASVNAFAQQAPRAKEIPGAVAAPPSVPSRAPQLSNVELTELLRAQTTAIKSLSSKLDSLEERIGKIEKRQR